MPNDAECQKKRVDRLERAIDAQKAFLHRVPDPDTRRRAEANLLSLVEMRENEHHALQALTVR